MPADDFDLDSLAAYLHLTPAQVARLAQRGRLPGRRIGSDWRFSQAEIHHWLEDRIGAGTEDDLLEVEQTLERAAEPHDTVVRLDELLPLEAIQIPLAARTRESVIRSMVELAGSTHLLWDEPRMIDAVRSREELHPTAMDIGVALMHPRRPLPDAIARPFLALGVTPAGVPFASNRGPLTDVFFLICSTTDRGHLRTLARLSRVLGRPEVVAGIRQADSAHEAKQVIADAEQAIEE